MPIPKFLHKYTLTSILALSFVSSCLIGLNVTPGTILVDTNSDLSKDIFPRDAAQVEFFHYPQVSNKYISPEASPGEGDFTLLSFSADQAINYTVKISAAYDIFSMQEMFFQATFGAYLTRNGTWLIASQPTNRSTGERRNIYLGMGRNTSSFSWQPLGLANNTKGITIASNGSSICVVYLETFLTDVGDPRYWPVRWVKYFNSSDYGATWQNGTLWDCSAWSSTTFSGISMDVTPMGYFECMWGFANASSDKGAFKISTIWEARKTGSGAWSTAKNLTAFTSRPVWGTAPQVIFDASNQLHVCVNNASISTNEVVLYLLEDGPDWGWTDDWTLAPSLTEDFTPRVFCAVDAVDGHYYFVNTTTGSSQGVRNASMWQGPLGDYDFVETRQSKRTYFLYANNGPHMFVDAAQSPLGETGPGILDAGAPFNFYQYNGSLDAIEEVAISFDGKDSLGSSHAARAFSLTVTIQSEFGSKSSTLIVGVDNTLPSLDVTRNTNYISPITSLGKNDSLQLNLLSNKSGMAILTVEAMTDPVHAKTNVTNEVFNYVNPGLCGDGTNYYLFYSQSEAESLDRLIMVKSTDGGLSWGEAVEVDTSSSGYNDIYPIMDGNIIYCWYRSGGEYFLKASFNGGDTFVEFALNDLAAVAEDKSVWNWDSEIGAESYNLSRSLDLGFTYESYLSIPATEAGYYSKLESVAYDTQSRNYSFLFTNNTKGVMAIITDYEGSTKIMRENIAPDGSPYNGNYQGLMQVDAWHNQTGEFNWIITCGCYYPFSFDTGTSPIAYCLINSSGGITSWDYFTAIDGEENPCFFNMWDLIFPANATPCYARSIIILEEMHYAQIEVSTATSFVYSSASLEIYADSPDTIDFYGVSSIGGVLPEGEYKWTLHYLDRVGHSTTSSGFVTIDHTLPSLGEHANFTSPMYAVPRLACDVTIPAIDGFLSHAVLRYRTGQAQEWINVTMTRTIISPTESNFTGTIESLGSAAVYWQVEIFDLAENSLIVDNNGQPYTYVEPQIRIEEQPEPLPLIDLTNTQAFNVSFNIPEFSEYVSYLFIEFTFDDGAGMHTGRLVAASPSLYYFTFENLPGNVTEIVYTVYAVDLYGKITPLGRVRTISLIPALPVWNLSPLQQLFAAIASLIVGIFTGLVYSSLTRRRLKPVSPRDTTDLELTPSRMDANTGSQGYKVAFIITALFVAGLLAGALYFLNVLQWSEAAMLCFLGTFLATTVLWIVFMDSLTLKVFREGRPRIRATLPTLLGFAIFIALIAMFVAGNNVAWWRVRINENPYIVFGIILPQLMTTLVATFFSSIIVLTRSIAKDVQRITKELADAELHNENPGRIFNRRETACQDILKSIGQKGVIFVVIIGITIVFASDLSAYAVQGVLIILPFAGGALLTLFVINLRTKIKEKHAETLLYDKLTMCPKCGKETTLGGSFCEHCGEALIKGTRFVPAEACPTCGRLTPKGSIHCRYCNALLPQNPTLSIKTGGGTPKAN